MRLVTGDRCAGLVAAVNELLPGARYQRCMVHFERNILAKVNPKNRDWAADALKAIFSMESRDKALEKAESVAKDMEARKLREAAKCLREGIGETTTYLLDDYPREHRRRIRTNNMIERLNREIRRRTRVVGSFPDGRSALMLICARVRYVTSSEWSTRRYLDMSRLGENVQSAELIIATGTGEDQSAQKLGHYQNRSINIAISMVILRISQSKSPSKRR